MCVCIFYLTIYLYVCLFIYLSVYLYFYQSFHLSVHIYSSIRISIFLSVNLHIQISLYHQLSPFTFVVYIFHCRYKWPSPQSFSFYITWHRIRDKLGPLDSRSISEKDCKSVSGTGVPSESTNLMKAVFLGWASLSRGLAICLASHTQRSVRPSSAQMILQSALPGS